MTPFSLFTSLPPGTKLVVDLESNVLKEVSLADFKIDCPICDQLASDQLEAYRKLYENQPREQMTVPAIEYREVSDIPQHRASKGSPSYHRRIQKKWDKRWAGRTRKEPVSIGIKNLVVSKGFMDLIKTIKN